MTYHDGELEIQQRAGETEEGRRNGVVIRDRIVGGARPFLATLSYAILGSVDGSGQPWAHLLVGESGFASTGDGRQVTLDLDRVFLDETDPLWRHLLGDPRLGLLFIDLGSRRRLRVNGRARGTDGKILVDVDEAYPNCPKYIQRRAILGRVGASSSSAEDGSTGTVLPPHLQALIGAADTLFVSSAHPQRGLDASHRGGPRGFVRILDPSTLEIPDYPGNSMFNTLGNLSVDPRAGLLFLDFEAGRILQVAGRTTILWDRKEDRDRTAGTDRMWRLGVESWREAPLPADLQWEFLDASPMLPA